MKYRAMKVRNEEPSPLSFYFLLVFASLALLLSGVSFQGVPLHFDWVYRDPSTICVQSSNILGKQLVSSQLPSSLKHPGLHIISQHRHHSHEETEICSTSLYECTFLWGNEENDEKNEKSRGEGKDKEEYSYKSHLSRSVGLNSFLQTDLGAAEPLSPPPLQHLALSALQQ